MVPPVPFRLFEPSPVTVSPAVDPVVSRMIPSPAVPDDVPALMERNFRRGEPDGAAAAVDVELRPAVAGQRDVRGDGERVDGRDGARAEDAAARGALDRDRLDRVAVREGHAGPRGVRDGRVGATGGDEVE